MNTIQEVAMKKITNRVIRTMTGNCDRCNQLVRVIYTITDEAGEKEYLCEDCVSKDDEIE